MANTNGRLKRLEKLCPPGVGADEIVELTDAERRAAVAAILAAVRAEMGSNVPPDMPTVDELMGHSPEES